MKSAVIQLTRNENLNIGCNEKLFKTVVKTAFNQRRKTLRNSLRPLIEKNHEIYKNSFFDKRPEQLDVTAFIQLTNQIEKAMKQ